MLVGNVGGGSDSLRQSCGGLDNLWQSYVLTAYLIVTRTPLITLTTSSKFRTTSNSDYLTHFITNFRIDTFKTLHPIITA